MAIFSCIISAHLQEIYIGSNYLVCNGAIQSFFPFSSPFLNRSIHSSSLSRHGFCLRAVPPWWSGSERQERRPHWGVGDTRWPGEGGSLGALLSTEQTQWPWTWWDPGSATAAGLQRGKSPASQLPKETRVATGVAFFIGNE